MGTHRQREQASPTRGPLHLSLLLPEVILASRQTSPSPQSSPRGRGGKRFCCACLPLLQGEEAAKRQVRENLRRLLVALRMSLALCRSCFRFAGLLQALLQNFYQVDHLGR